MEIIITDLTRFNTNGKVCIAGINLNTGQCIRPMPYLTASQCEELNILPGSKLLGDFNKMNNRGLPHSEDHYHKNLKHTGACTPEEFYQVLNNSLSSSIANGFGYKIPNGERVIPHTNPPSQSIVTLKVKPSQIEIVKDYDKIKLNFIDNDGQKYLKMPITDLGFYNYAMKHFKDLDFPDKINKFLQEQNEMYLRIGLSGRYAPPSGDRDGFWIQANGIYTFPNFSTEIRSY